MNDIALDRSEQEMTGRLLFCAGWNQTSHCAARNLQPRCSQGSRTLVVVSDYLKENRKQEVFFNRQNKYHYDSGCIRRIRCFFVG